MTDACFLVFAIYVMYAKTLAHLYDHVQRFYVNC